MECISRTGEKTTIGVGKFVQRQTEDSPFTHYQGSWNDLANRTVEAFEAGDFLNGYRDGVLLVYMPSWETPLFRTYDSYPMFEGMRLEAQWAKVSGREHEPAKLQIKILEPKMKCKYVDIVIYRKDVLLEDKDATTGADWDIVSINGRLSKDPPPIDPMTLVRNWLHLKGGTEMKGTTPSEMLTMLCDSILHKNGMKKHMSKNKKDTCDCKICDLADVRLEALESNDIAVVKDALAKMSHLWLEANSDVNYYKSILDGTWPSSKEILTKSLKKMDEERK